MGTEREALNVHALGAQETGFAGDGMGKVKSLQAVA